MLDHTLKRTCRWGGHWGVPCAGLHCWNRIPRAPLNAAWCAPAPCQAHHPCFPTIKTFLNLIILYINEGAHSTLTSPQKAIQNLARQQRLFPHGHPSLRLGATGSNWEQLESFVLNLCGSRARVGHGNNGGCSVIAQDVPPL